jgi:hypothetical protein
MIANAMNIINTWWKPRNGNSFVRPTANLMLGIAAASYVRFGWYPWLLSRLLQRHYGREVVGSSRSDACAVEERVLSFGFCQNRHPRDRSGSLSKTRFCISTSSRNGLVIY